MRFTFFFVSVECCLLVRLVLISSRRSVAIQRCVYTIAVPFVLRGPWNAHVVDSTRSLSHPLSLARSYRVCLFFVTHHKHDHIRDKYHVHWQFIIKNLCAEFNRLFSILVLTSICSHLSFGFYYYYCDDIVRSLVHWNGSMLKTEMKSIYGRRRVIK